MEGIKREKSKKEKKEEKKVTISAVHRHKLTENKLTAVSLQLTEK